MRALIRFLLLLGVIVLGLAAAMLERSPIIAQSQAPSSRDVEQARSLVHKIRALTNGTDPQPSDIVATQSTLNAILRMGSRMVPGLRAKADIMDRNLKIRGALPLVDGRFWVNVTVVVPPFDDGPRLAELMVGHLQLPPGLARVAMRIGGDLALGEGTGSHLLDSFPALEIEQDAIIARLDMDNQSRGALAAQVFGMLRGDEMPSAQEIAEHYRAIRSAMDDGTLPDRGSMMPHLRFAIERAEQEAERTGDRANAYTAAIFGLADACGAKDFALIADRLVTDGAANQTDTWERSCEKVTLSGRIDTKRHFITSAALQAASNRGVAISIGEFKELFDIRNSGGFDFTDMAADMAGVHLSDKLMREDADWSALTEPSSSERHIMIGFTGIPGKLSRTEFERNYGTIDSPTYRDEILRIEKQINALPLYVGG